MTHQLAHDGEDHNLHDDRLNCMEGGWTAGRRNDADDDILMIMSLDW